MRQILFTVLSIILLVIVVVGTISMIDITPEPKWKDCKVKSVYSGDMMTLIADGKKIVAKLAGVDVPESGQPFYTMSSKFVREAVDDQNCQWAKITVDGDIEYGILRFDEGAYVGEELNRIVLRQGYGWWDPEFSYDDGLKELEIEARNEQIGIWSVAEADDGS
jgi:endonuclease YncB( thermonuclease family)